MEKIWSWLLTVSTSTSKPIVQKPQEYRSDFIQKTFLCAHGKVNNLCFDLYRQGIHGMLPLHFAALNGFPDCCRKLLSNGKNRLVIKLSFSIYPPSFYNLISESTQNISNQQYVVFGFLPLRPVLHHVLSNTTSWVWYKHCGRPWKDLSACSCLWGVSKQTNTHAHTHCHIAI